MKKVRIAIVTICTFALLLVGAIPAFAATNPPKEYSPSRYTQGTICTTLGGKIYHVKSSMAPSKAFLDVNAGSRQNGSKVQVWGKTNVNAQRWKFTHLGNGIYTITNVHSNKVLDVPAASRTAGVNIQQYTSNKTNAQKWRVYKVGNYYSIVNVGSGLALDLPNGRTANGTAVRQWWRNDGGAERWILEAVNIPLKTLKMNMTSVNTKVGGVAYLKATLSPANTTENTIGYWSSNNTKVATVDTTGKVSAKGPGTATITVRVGSKSTTCRISVSANTTSTSVKKLTTQSTRDDALALQIFNQYNNYRASKGLNRVDWDPECADMAFNSAKGCAAQGRLVHRLGIPAYLQTSRSDILQYATWKKTAGETIKKWEESLAHKKMMQCPTATKAGVAVYRDGNSGKYYYVIVYDFAGCNQISVAR